MKAIKKISPLTIVPATTAAHNVKIMLSEKEKQFLELIANNFLKEIKAKCKLEV